MKEVIIDEYNESWPLEFKKIRDFLSNNLTGFNKIVHIGSTSIPNCNAKPIIDLVIEIESINELPSMENQLNLIGYFLQGDLTIKLRYAFKYGKTKFMEHHLYVAIKDSQKYREQIAFKEYLINNKDAVKEYISIKEVLAIKFKYDREAYTNGKTAFIESILQKTGCSKDKEYLISKPDYYNCILNIDASIAKKHTKILSYPSHKILDDILNKKEYKHYILLLLDGMGSDIIKDNLDANDFLNRYKVCDLSTIFPPTTAAAVTACLSGVAPLDSGWIGWENYIKEYNRHVILFRNIDYFTKEQLDLSIENDILPYNNFYHDFNTNIFKLQPAFAVNGYETFEGLTDKLVDITNNYDKSFTYAYWNNPDGIMHEYGSRAIESKDNLKSINNTLENMKEKLGKDTCLIITADHGHLDSLHIELRRFTKIWDLLEREPGNEGRCLCFKIKSENMNVFPITFNKYFNSFYDLYTRDEFLENEFLGLNKFSKKHERIADFIGDFIAVAKERYYFRYADTPIFKSHHAGYTKEEMTIPLIIFEK